MSLQFAVVHEAQADFETATELADRVLCDAIDWLDEYLLPGQRSWLGQTPGGQQLTWTAIKRLAHEENIRVRGHFDDKPALPDAKAARRAILYLLDKIPNLDAIVLIRDQDDQPERRDGLDQARKQDRGGIPIIVGLAVVERESWVLCGYDPQNEAETARLMEERKRLSFDPCEKSHELTAYKKDITHRSPKRALRTLSGGDRERERRCWIEASLTVLKERGTENGLAAYLAEVHARLVPLVGRPPQP